MSSAVQAAVLRDVDVLVVGASTGAAVAAIEARRAGKSVMLVSELSYLGEEAAGTLNLLPADLDQSDPVVAAMYRGAADRPAMPGPVKRALDQAVLDAGAHLMYLSRPVALLRDAAGNIAGAVLAARTSLLAVTCRTIIDATRYGVVARLARVAMATRPQPTQRTWNILSDGAPQGWAGEAEPLTPFRQMLKDGEHTYGAYRLKMSRQSLGADERAQEHVFRAGLAGANLLMTADILPDLCGSFCASAGGAAAARVAELSDAQLAAAPGVLLAGGVLPLTAQAAATLERSDVQAALGRRVGKLAAACCGSGAKARGPLVADAGGEQGGDYRFAPAFVRKDEGLIDIGPLSLPTLGRFDVAVAGGGTGGAPAGIAAARAGARTLVLEVQHAMGGVGTVGLITAYWFGNQVGFTAELDEAIMSIDPKSRENKCHNWSGEIKSGVYHRMLHEAGGAAWMGSYAFGVRMKGDEVDGLLVSTPFGSGLVEAACVVDATGNADIAAAAGATCRVIDARHVATQGTGLSPRVFPAVRYQNSDYTFVDETDPEGISHAFLNARAKFPHDFDTSPLVNTRERRQIIGEYAVSPLDILVGRTFPDTVATARSNFDTHGFIVHPLFMIAPPDHAPLTANVPFRCMLPRGLEGVLVTGLGMSAHRDALPVLRMQADVQNQGYAAGLAAAWAAGGTRLRDLDIRALQRRLAELGVVPPQTPETEDSFPMPAAAIEAAAAGDLGSLINAAVLLAHPAEARPRLLQIMHSPDAARRVEAALILGLIGCPEAADVLAAAVTERAWDEGWNYRGMGQFGRSMSSVDAMILALARTGEPAAAAPIAEKIRQLDSSAAFSHCRVAAIAAAGLKQAQVTEALAQLLARPGMQGHSQLDTRTVIAAANGDPIETEARNLSLRELHLARGLFLAGDLGGLGRSILTRYANDLRGHYARHASAVLSGDDVAPVEMA